MAYGGILGQTSSGGKKVCRLVVGTSTSGWTAADCDYLCDGTADDVEINAAIQALPDTGGEIVILDGTYNITDTIAMKKSNVKLSGNGTATILKRMWDSFAREGVITVKATNGGCCIENLCVDGNKAAYNSNKNYGIYLRSNSNNNTITGNMCNDNSSYGIYMNISDNNTITGNTCYNNSSGIYMGSSDNSTIIGNACCDNNSSGIYISGSNNTITGNTCYNNSSGIYMSGTDNNTITGNTCNDNNDYGIYLSSSNNNNTITGNTCNNNNYGIFLSGSDNNPVTGNTCNDNNYGISLYNSENNTVTGNTCIRGTGQASNYTSSQYTIWLNGASNRYNLIACNNIMGKNYVSEGGIGNSFADNKYN